MHVRRRLIPNRPLAGQPLAMFASGPNAARALVQPPRSESPPPALSHHPKTVLSDTMVFGAVPMFFSRSSRSVSGASTTSNASKDGSKGPKSSLGGRLMINKPLPNIPNEVPPMRESHSLAAPIARSRRVAAQVRGQGLPDPFQRLSRSGSLLHLQRVSLIS